MYCLGTDHILIAGVNGLLEIQFTKLLSGFNHVDCHKKNIHMIISEVSITQLLCSFLNLRTITDSPAIENTPTC